MTKLLKKTHKQIVVYLFFGEMGHHALARRSTSLTQQWRSYGLMGKMSGREGDVGGLRGKEVSRHPWAA